MRLLPSQRAHLYVLERSRIYVRDGRVEYASERGDAGDPLSFNIPIANTMLLLIGPGSSITQEAVRYLRIEGVSIGFCGSGGTPLIAANDPFPDLVMPADEYRDPSHLLRWMNMWADETKRLLFAKHLLVRRVECIYAAWDSKLGLPSPFPIAPEKQIDSFLRRVTDAGDVAELLGHEGTLTKALYAAAARAANIPEFKRQHALNEAPPTDPNRLLDHGNYLAYGLASVVLWTLGIPASLSVAHGKTRRGGLVFDIADVIKDALVLPTAFNVSRRMLDRKLEPKDSVFRGTLIDILHERSAIQMMFDAVKSGLDELC